MEYVTTIVKKATKEGSMRKLHDRTKKQAGK